MTDKQKHFADEYLIDLNATQAATRAGYSPNGLNKRVTRMMSNDGIQEYIKSKMAERSARTEITQDMVLKELAHIAFDDISNYLEFKTAESVIEYKDGKPIIDYRTIINMADSKDIDTRNISEISQGPNGTFKFKLYCKDNALVQIGKHLGMFTDKVELTGKDGGVIEIDSPRERIASRMLILASRTAAHKADGGSDK